MKYRYNETEADQAKYAVRVYEWCACTKTIKLCANSSKGDDWRRAVHLKLHGLDQTVCPDLDRPST